MVKIPPVNLCRFQKAIAPNHWASRLLCSGLLNGIRQQSYAQSAAQSRSCSEVLCTTLRTGRRCPQSSGFGQGREELSKNYIYIVSDMGDISDTI